MILEATMICIDNSEWMRNGDYSPSRFEAQADSVNLICGAKTQSNPENTVGVLTMAGKGVRVLATPTSDLGKILACMHGLEIGGEMNLADGIQVAQLALKHPQNKKQQQRIIVFAGSPVKHEKKLLEIIGRKLKKNNVALDIVNFGEEDEGKTEKLEALLFAVNNNDTSHIVHVPPGPTALSVVLISTPIFTGDGEGGSGFATAAGGVSGFDFDVDPNLDPVLALALRVSMEEERARQEAAAKKASEEVSKQEKKDEIFGLQDTVMTERTNVGNSEAEIKTNDMTDDENALLQRALAMSMNDLDTSRSVQDIVLSETAANDPELVFGAPRFIYLFFVEGGVKLPLPEEFLNFLQENGLDPSIYTATDSTPRYIRLKPGWKECLREFEVEMNVKLDKVNWLPGFYSLPHDIQIAGSKAYREGKIYGMDASSGAAVMALNVSLGDHVLDLCAAPGAKLCMILDLLNDSGTVTGVDVAGHRLAACRTLLQKYALGDRCRLFVDDGTTFSLIPVQISADTKPSSESELQEKADTFRVWTSRRPWKERKRASKANRKGSSQLVSNAFQPELIFYGPHSGVVGLTKRQLYQTAPDVEIASCGYDKVLVDAECTHDGSIKHIQKFEHWGWKTLQRRVLDAERTDNLNVLQLKLLSNGFKLLKVGGSLVYSTCSLTLAQNEDIVKKFLKDNTASELVEVDAARNWPCKSGGIPKTLRFDPITSQTSGLFVAKFTKLHI